MKALILIVEDNRDLLELLEHRLQKEQYETVGFLSTKYVKDILDEESVDLILMDRNLPDVEGSEYIAMLRDKGMTIPVIFLSAKDTSEDIIDGFLRGGDDYITKPFEIRELLLRINAMLQRTKKGIQKEVISFKEIVMDLHSRVVHIDEVQIDLTKLEFELLLTFIQNKDSVLTRDYLIKNIWGDDNNIKEKTVNVAIKRLKSKIDPLCTSAYIKTTRGFGYSIN